MFKNNNYNVQYNINNSFNIQSFQKNAFNSNNLSITTSASFNIKKIYYNFNQISKGKYSKDLEFQNKLKKICENKYDKVKKVIFDPNIDINKNTSASKLRITKRKSFFQRYSGQFSMKEMDKFKDIPVKRKGSFDKTNEDRKNKKVQNKNGDHMLNQITQNIIDLETNLNNPEIFYNEMFKNIVVSSKTASPNRKKKNKSAKHYSRFNNFSNTRKALINNEEDLNT